MRLHIRIKLHAYHDHVQGGIIPAIIHSRTTPTINITTNVTIIPPLTMRRLKAHPIHPALQKSQPSRPNMLLKLPIIKQPTSLPFADVTLHRLQASQEREMKRARRVVQSFVTYESREGLHGVVHLGVTAVGA